MPGDKTGTEAMVVHCSRRLAAKLPCVSPTPLEEDSPMGSWHGHLFVVDRRQCVLFCHDATRYVLFLPGLRKEDLAVLGSRRFPPLFLGTLAVFGCTRAQVRKAELALGAVRFDTATDRSVQGSIRIAINQDLYGLLTGVPDVMAVDPIAASCELSDRPATIYGKWVWPKNAMLSTVQSF